VGLKSNQNCYDAEFLQRKYSAL